MLSLYVCPLPTEKEYEILYGEVPPVQLMVYFPLFADIVLRMVMLLDVAGFGVAVGFGVAGRGVAVEKTTWVIRAVLDFMLRVFVFAVTWYSYVMPLRTDISRNEVADFVVPCWI